MLSEDRSIKLKSLVAAAHNTTMRSGVKRKAFAKHLAVELGMDPVRVQSFIDEMAGLNFFFAEDRAMFVDFALHGL